MANWHLNYGIDLNAKATDKLKCNVSTKGGNGLQLVMGGGIPEVEGQSPDTVIQDVLSRLNGLDGLDAKDPQNHVKYLRTIADFCTSLADDMEG